MADFKILTDSCCDLPPKLAQELELDVFPMTFVLEGREYQHHLDHRKMDNHKFYEGLRAGAGRYHGGGQPGGMDCHGAAVSGTRPGYSDSGVFFRTEHHCKQRADCGQ